MIGRNFGDCVALIRARHGSDYPVDALTSAWAADYDAIVAAEGISLKPGLDDILDLLDERGIATAVATSTRRERARAKLDRVGLLHRFAALVGGDEVARGKPAPDIFLAAAGRLGVAARDCIVLEDSEPGIIAAAGRRHDAGDGARSASAQRRAACPRAAGAGIAFRRRRASARDRPMSRGRGRRCGSRCMR